MSQAIRHRPVIHGQCPGARRPMASADGLVMRIRPPFGRLSQQQAVALADLVDRHGDGQISLTSRANLQIRGVQVDEHASVVQALSDVGLIDDNAEQERRRNLVQTPFWQEGDVCHRLGQDLMQALADPDAPELPDKFGFAVDVGTRPVLRTTSADIRLQRSANGDLICLADGAPRGAVITVGTAVAKAMSLARWFLDSGGVQDGRGRMASHLAGGAQLPVGFEQAKAQSSGVIAQISPGRCDQGWLIAVEFGLLTSSSLRAMASYGALRITPWRMVLIEGLQQTPELAGVDVLLADDPRLSVFVCTGAPGCPQANSPTQGLASALAQYVRSGERLHVAGCAKGCAHPAAAPVTLVATATDEYALIRQGSAGDEPVSIGLRSADLISNLRLWRG